MKMQMADGPKTELIGVSQRIQQSIEDMIASVSRGIGDCMENARNTVPRSIADDTRSSERRDAVQMVSSTADLLSSIAKLKGEFQHNYTINRISELERARQRAKEETGLEKSGRFVELGELMDPEEVEALSDAEREDYFRFLKLPPLDLRRASPPDRAGDTPLPENAGSNSDAGES